MNLFLANHSSYARIGDTPEQQKLRRAYAALERREATEADLRAAEVELTRAALACPCSIRWRRASRCARSLSSPCSLIESCCPDGIVADGPAGVGSRVRVRSVRGPSVHS